jgi:hypothetical protein
VLLEAFEARADRSVEEIPQNDTDEAFEQVLDQGTRLLEPGDARSCQPRSPEDHRKRGAAESEARTRLGIRRFTDTDSAASRRILRLQANERSRK